MSIAANVSKAKAPRTMVCCVNLQVLAYCLAPNAPFNFGHSPVRHPPPKMFDLPGVAGAAMTGKMSLRHPPPKMFDLPGVVGAAMTGMISLNSLCAVEGLAAAWLSADKIESDTASNHWHVTQNYTWCLRAEELDGRWEGPASIANRLRCMDVVALAGPFAMALVPTAAVAGAVMVSTMTLGAFCSVATAAAAWKSANMIEANTAMHNWRVTTNDTYKYKAEALYARWNDPEATIILWRAGRMFVVPRASEMLRNNGPWKFWLNKRPAPTSSTKLNRADKGPDKDKVTSASVADSVDEAFSDGFDDSFAADLELPQPEEE